MGNHVYFDEKGNIKGVLTSTQIEELENLETNIDGSEEEMKEYIKNHEEVLKELFVYDDDSEAGWEDKKNNLTADEVVYAISTLFFDEGGEDLRDLWKKMKEEYFEKFGPEICWHAFIGFAEGNHDT
jgi:hypothetical protein